MPVGKTGWLLSLTFCALLLSCAGMREDGVEDFIGDYGNTSPEPSGFYFCHSHNCRTRVDAKLSLSQWEEVRAVFNPAPKDPTEERKAIARAVGRLEIIVGKLTGTEGDLGGSLRGSFRNNQLDCVDEAINTGTYLAMLKKDGLIRFHKLLSPAYRGYFLMGWPHMAAVLSENSSGEKYAVDSWFLDNGEPPFIVPLSQWKAGWTPDINPVQ